jgi:ectoine hydroxylase-related dioxygenase (phytanoyl-CoA dioxygenase family)
MRHVNDATSTVQLQRLPSDCTVEEVLEQLDVAGAVIIEDYADPDLVERIREELRPWIDTTPGGRDDFVGHKTVRVGAVMARSPSSHALALDPKLNEVCKSFLAPHADGYQLHLTQLTSIGPREGEQRLHQDREVWGGRVPLSVETQFSTIWALTDFTKENGATRVVPGSHRWEPGRQPELEEIAYAEMEEGSVLIYTGSVIHGGGRNDTDTPREGLLLHNTLNWLRQEENQYLTCPPHIAQNFTPELRALLGYPSSYGMGFISTPFPPGEGAELVSPESLFRHPSPHWPGLNSDPTEPRTAVPDNRAPVPAAQGLKERD